MRRGLLVFNPVSGSGGRAAEMAAVATRARSRGLSLELLPTERAGHAPELVRERLPQGPELVAVSGGDGTVAEVASVLAGTGVPLAILPAGTANVIAREFGVGLDLASAEGLLSSRATRPLTTWPAASRVSVLATGVGFDARVMGYAVPVLKRLFGRAGIGVTATLEWMRYEFPPLAVTGLDAEGRPFSTCATFVLAANTRRYGGEPILSPWADPSDELLELVLFTSEDRGDLLQFYRLLSGGKAEHLGVRGVSRLAVRQYSVRSLSSSEVEVQVDGDLVGSTPVVVGPAGPVVRIVVPEG